MSDIKLGQLAPEGAQRDAIHVAIAPVVAGTSLKPGQHVALVNGKAVHASRIAENVGIVDPFLEQDVAPGKTFYLLLYQNTVTGMRHHWSHPAFTDEKPEDSRAPESEAWLRRFANRNGFVYAELLEDAAQGYVCFGDDDYPESSCDEFWEHYNALTGKNIHGYFRCAC